MQEITIAQELVIFGVYICVLCILTFLANETNNPFLIIFALLWFILPFIGIVIFCWGDVMSDLGNFLSFFGQIGLVIICLLIFLLIIIIGF